MSSGGSVEGFVSSNGTRHQQAGGDQTTTIAISKDQGGSGKIGTPALADLYTAVDITRQLRALVKTPPLILLINPQSLQMSYTKVQQFTDRTRHGFIFQAWGQEQPKLSISARCGAFISGGRGVQFASRRDSAAWQNVQTAFQFYRHNGYIYDTVGKSNAHHMVGALSIHYDGWVYYGNMESLSYTIDQSNQLGGVSFEMEFIVNAMIDTSNQSLVVTPMRSPLPSLSDRRYSGMENTSSSSPQGNISVEVADAVSDAVGFVQKTNYRSSGNRAPDGQQMPSSTAVPSGTVVPRGKGGFVSAQPATTTSTPVQRPPTPFGLRR